MEEPRAFIFDLDGVLADTVELHYHAWKQIAKQLNAPFTRMDMDRFRGRRRRDCLLDLVGERQLGEAELSRLLEQKDQIFLADLEKINSTDVILPGVVEFVENARARGVKLGVASSSANAKLILEKTGLMVHLKAVADGYTVKRSKPAPDIFIWVAGALRVRPIHAVVFEDSRVGVAAAQTAGMIVVGVGRDAATAQPDLAIANMQAIHVDDLLERISSIST